ncbi:hypothetical protein ABZ136_20180, partial [Streptomyces microflavus]
MRSASSAFSTFTGSSQLRVSVRSFRALKPCSRALATGGELFLRGRTGERFCVRNSGATVVSEGVG